MAGAQGSSAELSEFCSAEGPCWTGGTWSHHVREDASPQEQKRTRPSINALSSIRESWQGSPSRSPTHRAAPLCIKVPKTLAGSAPAAQGLKLPVFPDKQRPAWSPVALYNMSPHLLPNAASWSLFSYLAVPSLHAAGSGIPRGGPRPCLLPRLIPKTPGSRWAKPGGLRPLRREPSRTHLDLTLAGRGEAGERFLKVGCAPAAIHQLRLLLECRVEREAQEFGGKEGCLQAPACGLLRLRNPVGFGEGYQFLPVRKLGN